MGQVRRKRAGISLNKPCRNRYRRRTRIFLNRRRYLLLRVCIYPSNRSQLGQAQYNPRYRHQANPTPSHLNNQGLCQADTLPRRLLGRPQPLALQPYLLKSQSRNQLGPNNQIPQKLRNQHGVNNKPPPLHPSLNNHLADQRPPSSPPKVPTQAPMIYLPKSHQNINDISPNRFPHISTLLRRQTFNLLRWLVLLHELSLLKHILLPHSHTE